MTRQQEMALAHPCFEARETAHPRFRRDIMQDGLMVTVILTLNIGLE